MTPGITADSIVNLCGAIGLAVAAAMLHRRDARSPLTARLVALLTLVAALFLLRGIAWWTGNAALDRISLIPAALIPLGALVLTEGLLRRHAPRRLKAAALAGGVVLALAGALGPKELESAHTVALSAFQLGGFATCAALLLGRDRASLLAWENRAIDRVAFGAIVVIPFTITDFRVLAPDMPVRLGAIGALLAVTAILIAGAGAETQRRGVVLTLLRLVSAAVLGAATAALSPDVDAAQLMRYCAVAMAGVLTIGLMTAQSATHVIVLSHDPVELIVLAVSVISADPATETALALVRRLLVQAPETSP